MAQLQPRADKLVLFLLLLLMIFSWACVAPAKLIKLVLLCHSARPSMRSHSQSQSQSLEATSSARGAGNVKDVWRSCGGAGAEIQHLVDSASGRRVQSGECKVAQEKGRRRKAGALERQRESEREELTDAGWHSQLTRSQ